MVLKSILISTLLFSRLVAAYPVAPVGAGVIEDDFLPVASAAAPAESRTSTCVVRFKDDVEVREIPRRSIHEVEKQKSLKKLYLFVCAAKDDDFIKYVQAHDFDGAFLSSDVEMSMSSGGAIARYDSLLNAAIRSISTDPFKARRIIEILLERGVDVNHVPRGTGESPLWTICESAMRNDLQRDIIAMLILKGATPDERLSPSDIIHRSVSRSRSFATSIMSATRAMM